MISYSRAFPIMTVSRTGNSSYLKMILLKKGKPLSRSDDNLAFGRFQLPGKDLQEM